MRTFISLELPEEIKEQISLIQKKLKYQLSQTRWVKPEISHLTLAFLGSITPNKTEVVRKILEQSIANGPIKLKFFKIDCFPNPQRARTIYLDLKGDLDKLDHLVKNIRGQLKKEGIFFDEKPFAAHITFGRLKKRQDLSSTISKIQLSQKDFLADKISFVKSTLTAAGPIYQNLISFRFLMF